MKLVGKHEIRDGRTETASKEFPPHTILQWFKGAVTTNMGIALKRYVGQDPAASLYRVLFCNNKENPSVSESEMFGPVNSSWSYPHLRVFMGSECQTGISYSKVEVN